MSVIDEVKARADIVEIIGRYTVLKRAGSIYKGLCPFHNERTPSFVVFPNTQGWHCFGQCGMGGDVFSFLMKKENLEFRDVLERLAQEFGVPLDEPEQQADRAARDALYAANEQAAAYFHEILLHHPAAQPARDYLARRKIDAATIARFRLGWSLDAWSALRDHLLGRGVSLETQLAAGLIKRNEERESTYDAFRARVIIPIRERQGRTIGFGGRVLDDSQPKYLNTAETPLFHKSHVVYAIDMAHQAIRSADKVVIVEGYMDVIAAHQHGFANVVACMGTALTSEQLRQIQRYTNHFVLALDADAAGQAATMRGLSQARSALARVRKPTVMPGGRLQMTERLGASLAILSMPDGMDPDDVVRSDPALWEQLVAQARPLVDFYFDVVSRRVDLRSAEGKGSVVAELAPLIAEVDNDVERQGYIQKLSRLVQIDEVILDSQVRNAARHAASERSERPAPGAPRLRPFAPGTPPAPPASGAGEGPDYGPDYGADYGPDYGADYGLDSGGDEGAEQVRAPGKAAPARREAVGVEDHLLAMLLREPDLLIWLAQRAEELRIALPAADDLQRPDNQEIFRVLKRYITSDEPWDLELFQEQLAPPLHPRLATLVAYGAQLPPRTNPELREGMIKDIVHLRLQRLKSESLAVKVLVDDAQRNGELDSARQLGSVYGRIQRDLDHLQPLKLRENLLEGERRRQSSGRRH